MTREERDAVGAWPGTGTSSRRVGLTLLALVGSWALVGGCAPASESQEADLSERQSSLGPAASATLLKDLCTSSCYGLENSNPEQFTAVGGTTFFVASTQETGAELW